MEKRIVGCKVAPECDIRKYATVSAEVVGRVSFVTNKLGLDPNGWRLIMEQVIFLEGNECPLMSLDFVAPTGGGDSCAVAKMRTLKNHPDVAATGTIPEEDLAEDERKWLGGIQMPFTYIFFDEDNGETEEDSGVLRVAFSGAEEVSDLFVATYAARVFRDISGELFRNEAIKYDTEVLSANDKEVIRLASLFAG